MHLKNAPWALTTVSPNLPDPSTLPVRPSHPGGRLCSGCSGCSWPWIGWQAKLRFELPLNHSGKAYPIFPSGSLSHNTWLACVMLPVSEWKCGLNMKVGSRGCNKDNLGISASVITWICRPIEAQVRWSWILLLRHFSPQISPKSLFRKNLCPKTHVRFGRNMQLFWHPKTVKYMYKIDQCTI